MAELKNEFSWSKTRDEVFRTCPRQYWFAYYGNWNGWREDAPARTREIYVLKNLKNRQVWAGQVVHECIERSLNNIRRGIKVLSVDEIVSMTLQRMRTDFRSSRRLNYTSVKTLSTLFLPRFHCLRVCSAIDFLTPLLHSDKLIKNTPSFLER